MLESSRLRKYLAAGIAVSLAVVILLMVALWTLTRSLDPDPVEDEMPVPLRTIKVSSIASLKTAINSSIPGDQIVVANGAYVISNQMVVEARGTSLRPIVITSESVAGAEITGTGLFRLDGAQHVIVRGFKFTYSQDNTPNRVALVCNDCNNVRLTKNTFELKTAYAGQSGIDQLIRYHSDWLSITGLSSNNRIDHNVFQNKSTRGVFLILLGENGRAVQNTTIDHNLFRNHSYQLGNGGESIAVGSSSLGPSPSNTLIEYNLFERCNGDTEAITVKSSKNMIRHNTFRESEGSITLRHGSGNVVDGNIFDGDGGVRVYGNDHKIINNYFANNSGQISTLLNPIIIGRGTVYDDLPTSNAEYPQARHILIAHNTLVNNRVNIMIGYGNGSFFPEEITVVNNIITGSNGQLVQVQSGEVSFRNNIIFPTGSAAVGNVPASGYTYINPQLIVSDGMFRPSATSPAINAVQVTETYGVTTDIDGQIRTGMFDIGAHELS